MTDFLDIGTIETTFATAMRVAEERRSQKALAKARKLEEALAAAPDAHWYDSMPYRQSVLWQDGKPTVISRRMKALPAGEHLYVGTGIGLLYGLPGTERFADELGDWQIQPGSDRP